MVMMDQGIRSFNSLAHAGSQETKMSLGGKPLTIALVNNMPDAALGATERQFCSLLGAASDGIVVHLKFYSPPDIQRSPAARTHIAQYYENFDELEGSAPDGIIVTGTEPRTSRLEDEALWPALSRLVDWVDDCSIPSIWSCLAAHLAVSRMDGIQRQALPRKLSGVFDCGMTGRKHRILHGLPNRWQAPHSRFNTLRDADLVARGYSILSRSRAAGPDIFMKQDQALHMFFQGHPEYEATTLLREYRRDVIRFLTGDRPDFPEVPAGYFGRATQHRFDRFATAARRRPAPDLVAEFESLVEQASPTGTWPSAAHRVYLNWVSYLDARRIRPSVPIRMPLAQFSNPLGHQLSEVPA
jgi:homoserine O-succinyltransferase